MEEVIGSIPIRSTNKFFKFKHLPHPSDSLSLSGLCSRRNTNVSWTISWCFSCFALVRLHLPVQPIYLLRIHLSDDLAPLLLGFSVLLDRTGAHGLEEVKLNRLALTPCIRTSPRRSLAMIGEEPATIQAYQ